MHTEFRWKNLNETDYLEEVDVDAEDKLKHIFKIGREVVDWSHLDQVVGPSPNAYVHSGCTKCGNFMTTRLTIS